MGGLTQPRGLNGVLTGKLSHLTDPSECSDEALVSGKFAESLHRGLWTRSAGHWQPQNLRCHAKGLQKIK